MSKEIKTMCDGLSCCKSEHNPQGVPTNIRFYHLEFDRPVYEYSFAQTRVSDERASYDFCSVECLSAFVAEMKKQLRE